MLPWADRFYSVSKHNTSWFSIDISDTFCCGHFLLRIWCMFQAIEVHQTCTYSKNHWVWYQKCTKTCMYGKSQRFWYQEYICIYIYIYHTIYMYTVSICEYFYMVKTVKKHRRRVRAQKGAHRHRGWKSPTTIATPVTFVHNNYCTVIKLHV